MTAEPVNPPEILWEDIDFIIQEIEHTYRRADKPEVFLEIELDLISNSREVVENSEPDVLRFADAPALPLFGSPVCATVDPEIFFPEKGKSSSVKVAKKLCQSCTHVVDCREFAIVNEIHFGIWGAMTENERNRMRRMLRESNGKDQG